MAVFKLNIITPICISFIIIFSSFIGLVGSNDESDKIHALPYCGQNNKSSAQGQRELVIVSTLDGRVSALDASNDGLLEWSVSTGPGQMLSSSIHRLELTNNGHWVRMIPSLSGGLYKFNGDSIEAIPITADSLLKSSSFLFSDDLVISGGKESRTYGVALKTGQVLYECSMKGCDNLTENLRGDEDMLVVQRKTQTVRAVEVRTGGERWNFSVGMHDLKLISDAANNCHRPDPAKAVSKLDFKVVVPEGLVCAVSKTGSGDVVWKHKFDSPIVTAWHFTDGQMRDVDLFSGSQRSLKERGVDDILPVSPSLYIGMHKKQLYIQESVNMQRLLRNGLTDESAVYPRLPWVPVPASGAAPHGESTPEDATTTTALAVLYASEYVNGNGFYLFAPTNQTYCNLPNVTIEPTNEEASFEQEEFATDGTPVQVIMVSLWHWWKEVLIISVTTAAVLNLVINRNLIHLIQRGITKEVIRKEIVVVEKHVPVATHESGPPSDGDRPSKRSNSESSQQQTADYTSRYLTDFEQVHCLGKGGFGVVFEAKNKIDDCHYAIKRIALPNKRESRDRVLREVKALAKLEHANIVRYFNAWLECPPPGWEDEQDEGLQSCSSVEEGYSENVDQTKPRSKFQSSWNNSASPLIGETKSSGFLMVPNRGDDSSLRLPSPRGKSGDDEEDRSDSYIVFEARESKDEDSVVLNLPSSESGSERRVRPSSLDLSGSVVVSLTPQPPTRVYLFIQMQLCRKESLREWLQDNREPRDSHRVMQMFEQIVQAVEYVHLQGLIHRDLKPSNIFFSPDGQIKVGDFGLVTAMAENGEEEQRTPSKETGPRSFQVHTAQVGTHLYMSPEQLTGACYNYKVDIYSLGLILFELLVPFATQMERGRTLSELRRCVFPRDFPLEFGPEHELLRMMLSHSPELRPTTLGIRARPPLCGRGGGGAWPDQRWHFELPQRGADNCSRASLSGGSSADSWDQV